MMDVVAVAQEEVAVVEIANFAVGGDARRIDPETRNSPQSSGDISQI